LREKFEQLYRGCARRSDDTEASSKRLGASVDHTEPRNARFVQQSLGSSSADATVEPYGVSVLEVSDPSLANTVITMNANSPAGSAAQGVLGCETPGMITLVAGWNWYTGSDPTQVGPSQHDFEAIVLHELGHVLGLGHSMDPGSVMFATLDTGLAKLSLVTDDLDIPDTDSGPRGLHASTDVGLAPEASTPFTALSQEPAEGDIPLTPDPVVLKNAVSPPKTEMANSVPRVAPESRQALVSVRTPPSARRGTLHDLALDRWGGRGKRLAGRGRPEENRKDDRQPFDHLK
jgi:Matrixin